MRSLKVIVMDERCKLLADAVPTAHPRRMKAIDPHFEDEKPFFDVVSVGVFEPTAQSYYREGSQIACTIDQKYSLRTIGVLDEAVKNPAAGSVPRHPTRRH